MQLHHRLMALPLGRSLTIHGSSALDPHAILAQDDKSEVVIASMDAWQSILSGMVDLSSLQSLYLQATS
ncbi:hypothetical protein [Cysteiniphilum sp. 6C5]|uniref:hypothetical protein n=1 Tax=unclassified Cysteiniphilum TaxID=2610889 RepID=UPI003F875DDE